MHKPVENGNIKPLVVNDDNVYELTASEISCPKELDEPINPARNIVETSKGLMPNSKKLSSDVESDLNRYSSPYTGPGTYNTCNSQASTTGITAKRRPMKPHIKAKIEQASYNSHNNLDLSKAKGSRLQTTISKDATLPKEKSMALPSAASKKSSGPLIQRSPENCRFCLNMNVQRIVYQNLFAKYEATTQNTYNVNLMNDIILNSNAHITAAFKDFLIYDDNTEFLKGFTLRAESHNRLAQLTTYYDRSSKVFPNYVSIEEKKYLFKNIERKQKAIDTQHKVARSSSRGNYAKKEPHEKPMFTKRFIEEITERSSRSKIGGVQPVERMNLVDLVERFIDRDSLSMINQTNCQNIEPPLSATKQKPSPEGKKEESVKKPVVINVNQKGKMLCQVNNFMSPMNGGAEKHGLERAFSPIAKFSANHQHHQSQGQLHPAKKTDLRGKGKTGNAVSGRKSAAGYYRTYQSKESTKGDKDKAECTTLDKNTDRAINPETEKTSILSKPSVNVVKEPLLGRKSPTLTSARATTAPKSGIRIPIKPDNRIVPGFKLGTIDIGPSLTYSVNPHKKEPPRSGTPQTCTASDSVKLKIPPKLRVNTDALIPSTARASAHARATAQRVDSGSTKNINLIGNKLAKQSQAKVVNKAPAKQTGGVLLTHQGTNKISGRTSAVPTNSKKEPPEIITTTQPKNTFICSNPQTTKSKSSFATPKRGQKMPQTTKPSVVEPVRTRAGSAMGIAQIQTKEEGRPARVKVTDKNGRGNNVGSGRSSKIGKPMYAKK